jgi:hypothetical protein
MYNELVTSDLQPFDQADLQGLTLPSTLYTRFGSQLGAGTYTYTVYAVKIAGHVSPGQSAQVVVHN